MTVLEMTQDVVGINNKGYNTNQIHRLHIRNSSNQLL